jgi:Fe-S-cluster-containing dehydrogenase component
MNLSRRQFFSRAAVGAACTLVPSNARAEEAIAPPGALGLLYDATQCIGCQACVSACVEANNKAQQQSLSEARASERGLTTQARSTVKLYTAPGSRERSFVKLQCMHCVDPACVASCMFRALHKDARTGIVSWTASLCVGCRYCEIVCPYHVPRFEWHAFNPRIVKCELCGSRLEKGQEPACTSVCPTHAVIFGQRAALLATAHKRIAAHPGQYSEDRVYGERDGGGTQALYLSHVTYAKLGLRQLGTESIPARHLKWQKHIYTYLAAPAAVYALLTGVLAKRWRAHKLHEEHEEEATGLKPQL